MRGEVNDAVLAELVAGGGGAVGVKIDRQFAIRFGHERGDGGGLIPRGIQARDAQAGAGHAGFPGRPHQRLLRLARLVHCAGLDSGW